MNPEGAHDEGSGNTTMRNCVVLPMTHAAVDLRRNDQCAWDEFDSNWYFQHNYASVRDDDRQMLDRMTEFFANHLKETHTRHGIDVGPGTNLYPALTMLPFCLSITMWERSAANIAWLRRETKSFRPSWDAFWGQLSRPGRRRGAAGNARKKLAQSTTVCQGSIFELPPQHWDMGTMFFVAESITSDVDEFREAARRFVQSLKPGAPFAAAFMESSEGYLVGSYRYPAVPVTIDDIRECLSDLVDPADFDVLSIESRHPLREGYSGTMLLALGIAR